MTTEIQKPIPVTDDDLRRAAEALADVEDLWSKLASITDPTIPCDECGGAGTLAGGGIFGEISCPTCGGRRTVEHPAAHHLKQLAQPDFRTLRGRIQRLSAAHDQAQRRAYLGEGGAVSPVTQEDLAALEKDIAKVREEGRDLAVQQVKQGTPRTLDNQRRVLAGKPARYGSLGNGGGEGEDP